MRIPFVTEKVVDTILRSMRFGGFLGDEASADAIRSAPNDATEAELDTIAAGLSYGSLGGSADLSSTGDLNLFVDSDNDPPVGTNWFRVSQHQGAAPISLPENELLTLSTSGGTFTRDIDGPVLIIGPRPTLSPTTNYFGGIRAGTTTTGFNFFNVSAGSLAVTAGTASPGFRLYSNPTGSVEIASDESIFITGITTNENYGGWRRLNAIPASPSLHVGDDLVNDSIALERTTGGNFRIRITDTGTINTLFLRSDNSVDGYTMRLVIGGKEGETWGDPAVTSALDSTVLIVSPPLLTPSTRKTLTLFQRETNSPATTEILNIRSSGLAVGIPNPPLYLMRVYQGPVGLDIPVFNIKNSGGATVDANCPGGFITGSADVAEQVYVEGKASDYPVGTVLVVAPSGKMEASSSISDHKVMGVVVKQPGLKLGDKGTHDDSKGEPVIRPLKEYGEATKLVFDGDVTDEFSDVTVLKIHWDYFPVSPAVYDAESDTTTIPFQHGYAKEILPAMKILKNPEPITDVVNMTICGMVDVRCITTNGSVSVGDRIISAGGGRATVANGSTTAGEILGKALGSLDDDGSGSVTGTVRALVNLQ